MKFVRLGLLSGASLMALVIGTGTHAEAAACTAASGGTSDYSNDATCDYILITGDYTNGADVINNGVVGGGPLFAGTTVDSLFGLHGGLFGIVNTNTTVTIEGALINDGTISVINTGDISTTDIVIGIGNVVAEIGGGIINNGNIFVEASDPGTGNDVAAAIGIAATGVTDTIFQNATGAVLDVVAAGLDNGVPDTVLAQAAGVSQFASGFTSAVAEIDNNGLIGVFASAVAVQSVSGSGSVVAQALGIGLGQLATATTNAVAGVLNDGTLSVTAFAQASGTSAPAVASATAIGIQQSAAATIGATAGVSNSGLIDVHATASAGGSGAFNTAAAQALGVEQVVAAAESLEAVLFNSWHDSGERDCGRDRSWQCIGVCLGGRSHSERLGQL